MTRPIIRIHNAETDEVIDREMNDEEYAAYQAQQAADVAAEQAAIAKAAKVAANKAAAHDKLTALGLTADEIAALSK